MPERVLHERTHVVHRCVIASANERERPRRLRHADRPAWAGAVRDVFARLARLRRDRHRVADERRIDVHVEHRTLPRTQLVEAEHLAELRCGLQLPLHDRQLLVVLGVVDEDLQHEAVDLRLRQRIRALRLDRILGREDEERVGHRIRGVSDRHLALLHHLEQRALHLRGRAVDLVREEEVAEHRAELRLERARVGPVDPRADEVGRHEVGRELDARERPAQHGGRRLDRERLRQAGHALDQEMPLCEQAHEHALEHRVLPRDHPADLEERLLQPLLRHGRLLSLVGLDSPLTG